MEFVSNYQSKIPNAEGYVEYSPEEHTVWKILFERQQKILPNRACDAFISGLSKLEFSANQIPQLPIVSKRLKALTGWQVTPVQALISAREFFELLSQRLFPAATFIRRADELDYIKEPDIFHELFGHGPMLCDGVFADFVQAYARLVLSFPEHQWPLLQRLFWFTVEFGLIKSADGYRAYGGGILSSVSETIYSVESAVPMRLFFEPSYS